MTIHKQKNWLLYLFVGFLVLGGLFCNTNHADAKEVKNSPQLKATTSTISGKVLTGDEKPISGIKIELYDTSGTKLADTVSAADGSYQFSSLAAGDYYCKIDPTNNYQGWWGSYGPDNQTNYLHVDGSNSVNDVNMHLRYIAEKAGGIAGIVVDDNNKQAPVAGTTIRLYSVDDGGKLVATTVSAANGSYSFPDLINGTYYMDFDVPSSYTFHFQNNKTHFGQDQKSDHIYVDGKTVVNEGQPEGPSYGTTIHLLKEHSKFAQQYVAQFNDTYASDPQSLNNPGTITYGSGYFVDDGGSLSIKKAAIPDPRYGLETDNYAVISLFSKNSHQNISTTGNLLGYNYISSNPSAVSVRPLGTLNAFWINGQVGMSSQISIINPAGQAVYTFTINIIN